MKTTAAATAIGLGTLSSTRLSSAQTADDVFRRAQERFSQKEKNRSVSNPTVQSAKSDPDEAIEANRPNDICNGPVAIRTMVTAPPPVRQTPSARP
jgi:hypothetical protein